MVLYTRLWYHILRVKQTLCTEFNDFSISVGRESKLGGKKLSNSESRRRASNLASQFYGHSIRAQMAAEKIDEIMRSGPYKDRQRWMTCVETAAHDLFREGLHSLPPIALGFRAEQYYSQGR